MYSKVVQTDTCELMQRLQYCSACKGGGRGGGNNPQSGKYLYKVLGLPRQFAQDPPPLLPFSPPPHPVGGGGGGETSSGRLNNPFCVRTSWEDFNLLDCSAAPLLLLANRNTIFLLTTISRLWNLELLIFWDKKSQTIPYRVFKPLTNIKNTPPFQKERRKSKKEVRQVTSTVQLC